MSLCDIVERARRTRPKAQREVIRKARRKAMYGVNEEAFQERLKQQNGCCAICSEPFNRTPHIDHNHTTGRMRALLCFRCNTGLGHFKDSIELLQNAQVYLQQHS